MTERTGMETPSYASEKAKAIVDFWKNRRWLQHPLPVHVHQIDLAKLEELIREALENEPTQS